MERIVGDCCFAAAELLGTSTTPKKTEAVIPLRRGIGRIAWRLRSSAIEEQPGLPLKTLRPSARSRESGQAGQDNPLDDHERGENCLESRTRPNGLSLVSASDGPVKSWYVSENREDS